jgi:outer membrane lipopolysaccharide assembly protein LptE/RlpB
MKKFGMIWAFILLLPLLYSCGYHFPGSGAFPSNVETIFIGDFENRTSDTGIEAIVANQVIFEFTRRDKSSLAANREVADAHLSGVITKQTVRTISARGKDTANERRVTIWVNFKLAKPDGKVVWVGDNMSDNEAFTVDNDDKLQTERNQDEAIAVLSGRIAERVYNRLTDDF